MRIVIARGNRKKRHNKQDNKHIPATHLFDLALSLLILETAQIQKFCQRMTYALVDSKCFHILSGRLRLGVKAVNVTNSIAGKIMFIGTY